MFPGLEGCHDLLGMEAIPRADHHPVDRGVSQKLMVIFINMKVGTKALLSRLDGMWIRIGNRCDLYLIGRLQQFVDDPAQT